MRVLAVVVALGMSAWPSVAGARGGGARAHQERAFAALEAGDHATASKEFFEAFWLTRNVNLLLGAAQEAELAGLGRQAAAYYYLYSNLARLPAVEGEVIRRKVTEQHWATGARTAAAPPATSRATPPATTPAAPAATTPATPAATTPATPPPTAPYAPPKPRAVASSTRPDPDDETPFAEPFPEGDAKPTTATLRPVRPIRPIPRRLSMRTADKVDKVWYGRQVLVVEALAMTALLAGIEGDSGGAISFGVLGCLLGAPIVHLANGKGGGAWFASWGVRLLGIILVGATSESVGGVLFGYALGAGIDIALMSNKEVRRDSSVAILPTRNGLLVAWSF